jgi:hypothetical protein
MIHGQRNIKFTPDYGSTVHDDSRSGNEGISAFYKMWKVHYRTYNSQTHDAIFRQIISFNSHDCTFSKLLINGLLKSLAYFVIFIAAKILYEVTERVRKL